MLGHEHWSVVSTCPVNEKILGISHHGIQIASYVKASQTQTLVISPPVIKLPRQSF